MMTQEEVDGYRGYLHWLCLGIDAIRSERPAPVPPATRLAFDRYDAMMAALSMFSYLLNQEEDQLPLPNIGRRE